MANVMKTQNTLTNKKQYRSSSLKQHDYTTLFEDLKSCILFPSVEISFGKLVRPAVSISSSDIKTQMTMALFLCRKITDYY